MIRFRALNVVIVMKKIPFLLAFLFVNFVFSQIIIRTDVEKTEDHFPQKGVPKGELKGPYNFYSTTYPDTSRQYWLFIPAQYTSEKPASVIVFQDGFRASQPKGSISGPQVLENLIAKKDIPVSIGVFVSPGNTSKEYPTDLGWSNPNHRAAEYDALDNRYGNFIINELLPKIAKKYNLTTDPNQRAICGTSSGAIAAFTVAWHYPNMFKKVFSGIGSYVSIGFKPNENPKKLGGQDYPALIRREKIRPLRIFIQDGSNDIDNEWGNWFLGNQQMVAAFKYANNNADKTSSDASRYEVKAVWTDGEHSDKHPGALLPEALKWLWSK